MAKIAALKAALLLTWVPLVLGSTYFLEVYENRPGRLGPAITGSLAGSLIEVKRTKPTLVLFAHPHCPCTRATLEEIDRIMSSVPNKLRFVAVFYKPYNEPDSWVHTDLWDHACRIPGTECIIDPDGNECRRYGAYTSGTVILFNPLGGEVFRGGVTASRGHEGPCTSIDAITDFAKTGKISIHSAPVFGCAVITQPKL